MARKAYKLELTSQKFTYSKPKRNDCNNNSRNIFKTVNIILGNNIKQKHNALTDYLMCISYIKLLSSKLYSMSDCIKSKLELSPLILNVYRISQPIYYKLTSYSSPTITLIHNFIMIDDYISPIFSQP